MNKVENIADRMKQGMRHLASGVAVIATRDNQGQAFAMTVSSITSLTDSPPSLLICIHQVAQTHLVLREAKYFSASILAENHQDISQICAAEPDMKKRFQVGQWQDHDTLKIPYLTDALSVFFCRISQRIDYGTHMIVIGDIQSVDIAEHQQAPLVYCRGAYHTLC